MDKEEYGIGVGILALLIVALSAAVFVLSIFLIYGGTLETTNHGVTFKGIFEMVFGVFLILVNCGGITMPKSGK